MHPIVVQWGPLTVYSYGVALALAVLLATQLAARRAPAAGVTAAQLTDVVLWSVAGGLLGARLVYVAQHWPEYAAAPGEILRLDHGGLVFYGGLAGGLLAGWGALRWRRLPAWSVLAVAVPFVALGQGIGRVGCFLNGCCYGAPTTVPWGVRFPGESFARHPTQLYESLFLIVLAVALLWRGHRRPAPSSQIGWYLVGYGVWRFAIEWLRGDNPAVVGPWTFSQLVSVPLVIAGLWLLRRRPPLGGPPGTTHAG